MVYVESINSLNTIYNKLNVQNNKIIISYYLKIDYIFKSS